MHENEQNALTFRWLHPSDLLWTLLEICLTPDVGLGKLGSLLAMIQSNPPPCSSANPRSTTEHKQCTQNYSHFPFSAVKPQLVTCNLKRTTKW